MKKPVSNKSFFGMAILCAAATLTSALAPLALAQQSPAKPDRIPLKGSTLLTTDTQVPMPAALALRGTLKADKKTLKAGEPVTFTYSVTNTGKKEPQTLQFSTGQRFDMTVQPKNGAAPVWQFSKDKMFTMMLGAATFAPGETKTFTATWKPAPGEIKPGASYTVMAHLTPMGKSKPGTAQTAHATLSLSAAK